MSFLLYAASFNFAARTLPPPLTTSHLFKQWPENLDKRRNGKLMRPLYIKRGGGRRSAVCKLFAHSILTLGRLEELQIQQPSCRSLTFEAHKGPHFAHENCDRYGLIMPPRSGRARTSTPSRSHFAPEAMSNELAGQVCLSFCAAAVPIIAPSPFVIDPMHRQDLQSFN